MGLAQTVVLERKLVDVVCHLILRSSAGSGDSESDYEGQVEKDGRGVEYGRPIRSGTCIWPHKEHMSPCLRN